MNSQRASAACIWRLLSLVAWLCACHPGPIDTADGLSETGESGDTDGSGDGDGDPVDPGESGEPGTPASCDGEGCACAATTCGAGLVCTLAATCDACPPGFPGCPCDASGQCAVGTCHAGEDEDGTAWSICYPADLVACAEQACPGDAHCTDERTCAWSMP